MITKTLAAAGLFLAGGSAVSAQDTPEAWLSRIAAAAERPVIADQEIEMFMTGVKSRGTGHLIIADRDHFRVEMTMTVEMKGMDSAVVSTSVNHGDGEHIWMENRHEASSYGRVGKLPLEEFRRAAVENDLTFRGSFHPARRLLDLAAYVRFEGVEHDTEKATVTLRGKVTEEGKSKMINEFRGGIPQELIVEVDAETGFPISYQLNRFNFVLVSYRCSNIRHPDPSQIDMSQFRYELPEGMELTEPSSTTAVPRKPEEKQ